MLKGLDHSALQRVYDERLILNPGAEKMLKADKNIWYQDNAYFRWIYFLH